MRWYYLNNFCFKFILKYVKLYKKITLITIIYFKTIKYIENLKNEFVYNTTILLR